MPKGTLTKMYHTTHIVFSGTPILPSVFLGLIKANLIEAISQATIWGTEAAVPLSSQLQFFTRTCQFTLLNIPLIRRPLSSSTASTLFRPDLNAWIRTLASYLISPPEILPHMFPVLFPG